MEAKYIQNFNCRRIKKDIGENIYISLRHEKESIDEVAINLF